MLKPSGPLPPRVYWLRRLGLLVVGVLLVVVALAWLSNGRNDSSAATGPRTRPTTTHPATASSTPGHTSPTDPGRSPGRTHHSGSHQPRHPGHGRGTQGGAPHSQHPGSRHTPSAAPTTPLATPTGECDPRQVGMSIDVPDSVEGHPNTATLVLTVPASVDACTLQITPESLVVHITSGSDVVWSSNDCPDALPARQVVVRHDPATVYSLSWNGRRSTGHCGGSPGAVAPAGGYWVEAALISGAGHKAYFDITPATSGKH